MPLTDHSGQLGLQGAAHLLRRATFGATKQKIFEFRDKTADEAIAILFRQTLATPLPPIDPLTGQEWMTTGPTGANSKTFELQDFFKCWFIGQMMSPGISSTDDLNLAHAAREKLVFFLHTHFTTIREKVDDSRALYFQNQLFRFFALDALNPDPEINFKTLTAKICVDSAMLRVLDGTSNVKGSPNENFARELFELYTIGRGLDGKVPPTGTAGDYYYFKEDDVKIAARVLSGWRVDDNYQTIDELTLLPRGTVRGGILNASSHDNDAEPEKRFSDRFNNTAIIPDPTLLNGSQPTEASAMDEIEQLIDMIYLHSKDERAAARNICWKIYRFYVWGPHTPDEVDPIDTDIITDMANIFVSNGYKLQPVIEALLKSTHFYQAGAGAADDNFGGIIKSPLDLIIGSLRFFDVQLPDMYTDAQAFYEKAQRILGEMSDQGMNFYDPYDVAGYEAYHQYPIYHRFWITPSNLTTRYRFVRDLVTQVPDNPFQVNVYQYTRDNFSTVAASAPDLVRELARYLLPVNVNIDYDDANDSAALPPGITSARLNYFKLKFLDLFSEAEWTDYWNNDDSELRVQLQNLYNAMLQSPEYQLS